MENSQTADKKAQFEKLYREQEDEREKNKQNKIVTNDTIKDKNESMLVIQKNFKDQYSIIQKTLELSQENIDIDKVFEDFNKLKDYIVSASYCMTTYDKQTYKDSKQLDKLELDLQKIRNTNKPRKKFAFSKKIDNKKEETVKEKEVKSEKEEKNEDNLSLIKGLENLKNETLVLTQNDLDSSFKLCNLENTTICLNGRMKAVFLKNLTGCKINLGVIEGACFIDKAIDCEIQIVSHQVRIHNSKNTTFKLYCTSKPIMEHSEGLKFGQYSHTYDQFEEDFNESKFKSKQNLWDNVQDFNWLKQDKSPNFDLI